MKVRFTKFAALLAAAGSFALPAALHAQPASPGPAQNRILELDGTGGYVELPPNIFNDLTEATVELWVRWDDFSGDFKRAFNYGDARRDWSITTRSDGSNLWFVLGDTERTLHNVEIPNVLQAQQWTHVAAVSGPGGMQLYLNGVLLGTNEYSGSFAGLGDGNRFRFGRTVTPIDPPTNFKGAMDEVRVWRERRTAEQIREGMPRRLIGNEPGLVGLWNFDDPAQPARDASTGAHHGNLVNGARTTEVVFPGQASGTRVSRLLALDGNGSYVEFPANAFTNLTEITVEGWVKWESLRWMSRFFDFAIAERGVDVMNRNRSATLYLESYIPGHQIATDAAGLIAPGQWFHVAAVTRPGEVRLYANGILLATNLTENTVPGQGVQRRNLLGRSNWKAVYPQDEDFHGQMDEVRVWNRVRSVEEIRANQFRSLTGREPGLVALWNFDDPAQPGRDATTNGWHGRFEGQARVVEGELPQPGTAAPWSRFTVGFVDALGRRLRDVTLRAEGDGLELAWTTNIWQDAYSLTLWSSATTIDLHASSPRGLGGWKLGVPIEPYTEQRFDWTLPPAVRIGGRLRALDGRTPISHAVVELVRPQGSTDPSSLTQPLSRPTQENIRSVAAAPSTNGVLYLPRDGSYATLPSFLFQSLTNATIECWVQYHSDDRHVVFDFGLFGSELWIQREEMDLVTFAFNVGKGEIRNNVPHVLRTNEWVHLAMVTGTGGLRGYVNGTLMVTNPATVSFASITDRTIIWAGTLSVK